MAHAATRFAISLDRPHATSLKDLFYGHVVTVYLSKLARNRGHKVSKISPMILDTVFITTPEENKDQRQRYKIQVLRILASARCNYKKQALQEHDCLPPWPFAIAKSDR
ncbi:hypothetical protein HZH66_003566 [Vespula vulgaris]|uniref:Uncharacterized protein n=1 Tax=Vespula vulgaris TaxID=7454 RepID=A0A834ND71_VESVU|nr:hypothetical protein HZH66_003566 [Vespula vulgaris]